MVDWTSVVLVAKVDESDDGLAVVVGRTELDMRREVERARELLSVAIVVEEGPRLGLVIREDVVTLTDAMLLLTAEEIDELTAARAEELWTAEVLELK